MKKTIDGLKWVSVSITVASLVTVFWVWPAWNSGSQRWYWGNNEDSMNTMYRNVHPPSGHNAPFEFEGSFNGSFMANEPAAQMLTFGPDPWQYHIEWYLTPMMMTRMGTVMFSLTIGRYSGMGMMMYVPFFSATGSGFPPGSFDSRTIVEGFATPIMGMMGDLVFMPGDMLGAMVMFMTSPSLPLTVPLANTSFITSPLSDPGYPGGGVSIPTLSQWGMLVLAILLPLLYPFVIKRRIRIGRS
ncbi:MAG: hypothetical protein ABSB22_20770 [Thermodesulfobacteriota bacterium]